MGMAIFPGLMANGIADAVLVSGVDYWE